MLDVLIPGFVLSIAKFVLIGHINCFFSPFFNVATVEPNPGKSKREISGRVPFDLVKVKLVNS